MRWFLMLALVIGCAHERDAAPLTLDEMAHAVYRDWEDDELLTAHMVELHLWLDAEGQSEGAWDGLQMTDLADADVASATVPAGAQLVDHVGIATATLSPFAETDHAPLLVEFDQRWTDPSTFDKYERTVIEGDDNTFGSGQGMVRTENDIVKTGPFGVVIPYQLRKDYKWVDADGRMVVVGRNWVTLEGCSDNGKNCVIQSFGLDVFSAHAEGSQRFFATWIEVRTEADSVLSEEARIGLLAKGNQDIIEAADEELARRAEE
jgi:hypothetical protein